MLMMNLRSRVNFSSYPQQKNSHIVVDLMLVTHSDCTTVVNFGTLSEISSNLPNKF